MGQEQAQPSVKREDLLAKTVAELRAMATELGIDAKPLKKKDEIVDAVLEAKVRSEGFIEISGILDVLPEGYGFVRTAGYLPGDRDVYVSMSVVRRNELRRGDMIRGQVRPPKETEKYPALQRLDAVNDMPAEQARGRKRFSDLTPVYPDERLRQEHGKDFLTARTIDLVAPIGKGQRGLIVSPPKAGKTTVLKDIAAAITANDPAVHLMCLLVDERPEEVTDMERSIHGEVVSSTFDMPSDQHIAVAELVMERAKRLVESGRDVVILLDSITRLARAYNLATPASGRILSGGVDSQALYPPKKFFGAARNIEHGGSLTILATALVDTGSKMDEVIFEEFKGTGNMELRLDRSLADRRIFPAIDVITSGTRKEELLLDPQEAPFVWGVRRILHGIDNPERAMDMLIKGLKQTSSNIEFLTRMAKQAQTKGNGIDL
jgi:transcription termination factor Rho